MDIPSMADIFWKKCGVPNFLTPHAFWNISDFGAKCEKCGMINMIMLQNGELRLNDTTPAPKRYIVYSLKNLVNCSTRNFGCSSGIKCPEFGTVTPVTF